MERQHEVLSPQAPPDRRFTTRSIPIPFVLPQGPIETEEAQAEAMARAVGEERNGAMSFDPHNFFSLPPDQIRSMRRAMVMQAIGMTAAMAIGCLAGIVFLTGIIAGWW